MVFNNPLEGKGFLRRIGEIIEKIERVEMFKTVYGVKGAMIDLECAIMQLNTINELVAYGFYDEVVNRLFQAHALISSAISYSKVQSVKEASVLLMECADEIKELIIQRGMIGNEN